MSPALRSLLAPAAVLALAAALPAQVLPGQVMIDPEHPQWLLRAGGEHVFICGPGDPEDFLYRGIRLPDGTRNGDQDEIIDTLIDHGGNSLYMQVVRSHGGDGSADHNPFVNSNPALGLDADILDQWEGWFDRADAAGILVYLFFFDDSANIWGGGNAVPPAEQQFVTAIVERFEHHPSLIWLVAEESEEAFSHARVRNIAAVIAAADEHDHVIGNHHHSGTAFLAWQPGSALNHFSMQSNGTAASTHGAALQARAAAEATGNAYMVIYSEAAFLETADESGVRAFLWDNAMAGVMPMVYTLDVASTPDSWLAACRTVQEFFESTEFHTMKSRDDLAAGGTTWVLADPPQGYIAYARSNLGALGLLGVTAGFYDLLWVDAVTGAEVSQPGQQLADGSQAFTRPPGIGAWCALSLQRAWLDVESALPGVAGPPKLAVECTMEANAPFVLSLEDGAPVAPATFALGLTPLLTPFAGGILVPYPDMLWWGVTGSHGELTAAGTWPAGFPSGSALFIQAWVVDAAGPEGWAASNALVGVAP